MLQLPVLFDASWLAYRSKYTMGDLSHKGEPTAIIFGFLDQLRTVCADPHVNSTHAAIFFDSRHSYRRDYFPDYKKKRNIRTPEEFADILVMHDQMRRLRKEILPDIGFPCFQQYGLESDDLIAQAADQLEGLGATIITADGDLYQCITSRVSWYDPQRNIHLDPQTFWAKYEVYPEDWATVKAVGGCKTDEVPGVGYIINGKERRVGEDGAISYVLRCLKEDNAKYKAIMSEDGQRQIAHNYNLVKLPHRRTKPIPALDPIANLFIPKYKPERFFKWCEKLGFASFLEGGRKQQWEAFFAGQSQGSRMLARKREKA